MADEQMVTIPSPRACPDAPPEAYLRLLRRSGISRVALAAGGEAWAVTRHADIRAMLADPRFSSDRGHPNFPVVMPGQHLIVDSGTMSLLSMDPPEHTEIRRWVIGEFTARRAEELRPRIQEIVDQHVSQLLAGPRPADIVRELSLPVPSLVMCELLGVPYEDHPFFQRISARMLQHETTAAERVTVRNELVRYLDALVTRAEQDPGDTLLGRLARRQQGTGTAQHIALLSMALLLLIAGHETTANMISLGTLRLLEDPALRETINADPARTPDVVEELLRWYTIVDIVVARVATKDAEISGVKIAAGEGIVALGSAANRDPAAFDSPDTLDIERGARHHLAFGFGAHQCLGQNLARLELQIVFDTLFRRVPGLRLAVPSDAVPLKNDSIIFGAHQLPVTW